MPAGPAKDWIYLVDAHSLIFQVFHAIRQGMNSPSGLPTGALFGFSRDLLFLRQKKPRCLVCAFDREEPLFRSEVYPDYKAHRDPMPSDLELQIPFIHQVLEAMAVPVVSYPGFEADDVLATLSRAAEAQGYQVLIYSSDKDCRQLLTDNIRMYNLRKREEFGKPQLLADWGITPEQVVDLQMLVGDTVDNVPGVAGIGVKTAAKLLQEFGTLEVILQNIDKVPGAKKQESLRAAQPLLPTTRKLVELVTDVPVVADWDGWRLKPMNVPRLLELFREFGFHSMARQVREMPEAQQTTAPGQGSLFPELEELFPFGANASEEASNGESSASSDAEESPGPLTAPPASTANLTMVGQAGWQGNYHLVDTPEQFESFFEALTRQSRIAFDLETTSLEPLLAEIVGLAFAWQEGEAWYLALRGPLGSKLLDPVATLARLRLILENPAVAKVNQNIKYDLLVLRGKGILVQGVVGDCMLADYLLHAGERSHNLEELARRYLNHQVIPITDLIGKKGRKQLQLRMDQVPPDRSAVYAGEDADVAWRLCQLLESQLEQVKTGPRTLRKLYDDLEVPLIEVLVELEANGIRIDIPKLRELSEEMRKQLEEIEKEIYTLAGHPFLINSLVQLRKVLFEELKLPRQRKTGVTGAASTDQETLEKLAALKHPGAGLPRKILEHRQVAKLKGTYVDALPDLVNPRTGRIHTSFNQTVAATGRLSASDPNLQNIPVRREQGQQIRQAFLPENGWLLVTADYSQIELRLLAHFSGDEELRRAFAEDRDVHTAVASQIFHVEEKDVTSSQRRVAKTVNFGVIYGMSAHGLSQRLSIPRDEAETWINAYFARYPRVLEYQTRLLQNCRKLGFVSTILGRRRPFDRTAIRAGSTYQQRNQAEREAINMEVQGSAADLIKLAMLNLLRRLRREGLRSRMLLQIHDELVFEAPPEEMARLVPLIREEMTTPLEASLKLGVRLKVDVAAGPNWLDGTEV
jgi:DNA polymerase I